MRTEPPGGAVFCIRSIRAPEDPAALCGDPKPVMSLIYDRESDRLVGGDFLREVSGRWTLSLILSLRRGKLLHETVGHLAAEYEKLPADLERAAAPFATPLALIELHEFPADVEGATVALSVEALFG